MVRLVGSFLYYTTKLIKKMGIMLSGGSMKNLKERISDVSQYLQKLMDPTVLLDVENAVERKDNNLLAELCRKSKIPEIYIGVIVSVLLSVGPRQKWPYPDY